MQSCTDRSERCRLADQDESQIFSCETTFSCRNADRKILLGMSHKLNQKYVFEKLYFATYETMGR